MMESQIIRRLITSDPNNKSKGKRLSSHLLFCELCEVSLFSPWLLRA